MTTSGSTQNASPKASEIETGNALSAPVSANTTDAGRIRFGVGCHLPRPVSFANTADTGRIRFGAGCRIPATR